MGVADGQRPDALITFVGVQGVSAQEATSTWDCTTPSCPGVATKKGPGGKPYCDPCRVRIYEKKVETTRARHGTAGGGGHEKALVVSEREGLDVDLLTRRLRVEARFVVRSAKSPRRSVLLPEAKKEVILTVRELMSRLASV